MAQVRKSSYQFFGYYHIHNINPENDAVLPVLHYYTVKTIYKNGIGTDH